MDDILAAMNVVLRPSATPSTTTSTGSNGNLTNRLLQRILDKMDQRQESIVNDALNVKLDSVLDGLSSAFGRSVVPTCGMDRLGCAITEVDGVTAFNVRLTDIDLSTLPSELSATDKVNKALPVLVVDAVRPAWKWTNRMAVRSFSNG